jgi:hypothetical protein
MSVPTLQGVQLAPRPPRRVPYFCMYVRVYGTVPPVVDNALALYRFEFLDEAFCWTHSA